MDWFLCDRDLQHERVKEQVSHQFWGIKKLKFFNEPNIPWDIFKVFRTATGFSKAAVLMRYTD